MMKAKAQGGKTCFAHSAHRSTCSSLFCFTWKAYPLLLSRCDRGECEDEFEGLAPLPRLVLYFCLNLSAYWNSEEIFLVLISHRCLWRQNLREEDKERKSSPIDFWTLSRESRELDFLELTTDVICNRLTWKLSEDKRFVSFTQKDVVSINLVKQRVIVNWIIWSFLPDTTNFRAPELGSIHPACSVCQSTTSDQLQLRRCMPSPYATQWLGFVFCGPACGWR